MARIFLPALVAVAVAGPALAQDAASIASSPAMPAPSEVVMADDIEGAAIVSLEGDYNQEIWQDSDPLQAMMADLSEIGSVEDVALAPDGRMIGVTTDVGGFIGIGQKTVLIPLEDIRLVRAESGSDVSIVTRLGQDQLRDLPEFEADD